MPVAPVAAALACPPAPPAYHYAELERPDASGQAPLAAECALALNCNGLNHAVLMVSPSDLEDFVHGFCLGSGLLHSLDELYELRLSGVGAARQAELRISSRAFWALKLQRRQLPGSGGCGLCGVEALEQALPELTPLPATPLPPAAYLAGLRERVATCQEQARHSGALHAALFVDGQGQILLCREDIGRHNALDKLIGALARQRLDARQGFALVTSRCGLELLHKVVRAGIPTLVSLSAPTALTVDWARHHRLNLIHLPHHSAPRVYSPAPAAPEART